MRSRLLAKALQTPSDFTLVIYFYRLELVADFVEIANDIKYRLNASDDFLVSTSTMTVFFGAGGRLALRQTASMDDGRSLMGLQIDHLVVNGPVPQPLIDIARCRIRMQSGE